MRGSLILVVWLLLVVLPAVAHAQDNEALRREVEQLRRQQEQYQKTIEALNERLKRLELQNAPAAAQPAPPATPPTAGTPVTPGAPAAAAPAGSAGSSPSALDLLSPRQPFSLYQQRGAGQLLFDLGVTGDFVGNLTQRNVQKAQDGTFSGRENRFFPREVELSLFGQIDFTGRFSGHPYADFLFGLPNTASRAFPPVPQRTPVWQTPNRHTRERSPVFRFRRSLDRTRRDRTRWLVPRSRADRLPEERAA